MHRFYAPHLPAIGEPFPLPEDEARHLAQVLRLAPGDEVRVFDGRGREHAARVEQAGRGGALLRLGAAAAAAPEPPVRITLAPALLKQDRFDAVVRDATMLGVAGVQPVVTARTEAGARRGDPRQRADRWRRIAVSSAKQCGRAIVPLIEPPVPVADALDRLPRPLLLAIEPSAAAGTGALPARPETATLLVGPEGGWTPGEIDAARAAGASFVSFGQRTLRADAAPLVTLTVLLHEWGGL